MTESLIISPQQEEIISQSVAGKTPEETAALLHVSEKLVLETLTIPAVIARRLAKIDTMDFSVNLERLTGAKNILPQIIAGIQKIASEDALSWKMVHFKLFEMLLRELPKAEASINKTLLNVQINNNGQADEEVLDSSTISEQIDYVLKKLPATKQMQFWQDVDILAQKYVEEFKIDKVIELKQQKI